MVKDAYLRTYAGGHDTPEWTRLFHEVWAAIGARNLSGIIYDWPRWLDLIWDECRRSKGGGTDWTNEHPINVVLADKLAQLATDSATPITHELLDTAYEWLADHVFMGVSRTGADDIKQD